MYNVNRRNDQYYKSYHLVKFQGNWTNSFKIIASEISNFAVFGGFFFRKLWVKNDQCKYQKKIGMTLYI